MEIKMIKKIILKYNSLIRFLIVGGISTCIDFLIYMFLSNYIYIYIAKTMSMLVSMSFSFVANKYWSFNAGEEGLKKNLIRYCITQVINLSTNVGINYVVYLAFKNKLLAFVIATGAAMIVNYLLQKKFVFNLEE